jgi:predicted permease
MDPGPARVRRRRGIAKLAAVDRRVRARAQRAGLRDAVQQDLRYALRGLRREPGFAAAVVLVLAIAVGATGAVFSLIDPLFLRVPPGLTEPGALRRMYTVNPSNRSVTGSHTWRLFSYAEFQAIRSAVAGRARVAVFVSRDSVPLVRNGDSSSAAVSFVTADFLPMLTRPGRGRFFGPDEDDVHQPTTVAVISARFQQRHFGVGVDPINQTLSLDGQRYTIVGVTTDAFEGIELSAVDVWVPYSTNRRLALEQQPWYDKGGVSLPMVLRLQSREHEAVVTARASLAYSRVYAAGDSATPGRAVILGSLLEPRAPISSPREVTIATRLAMVSLLVLCIACANVANLLLVRAIRRRRETAVRLALGVSRRRLASQAVVESLVLAALAAAAALLVSRWLGVGLRALVLPRVDWIGALPDWRVGSFVILLTLLATLVASLVALAFADRKPLVTDLAAGGHTTTWQSSRIRSVFLVAQTALSMLLLVGTALFVRSLGAVTRIDMGFDTPHLVVASAYFDDGRRHPERGTAFPEVAERLRGTAGITAVAYGSTAPLYSWYSFVQLFPSNGSEEITTPATRAEFIAVSGTYFSVVGTRIVKGRAFGATDSRGSPRVMVIGETMARLLWPDRDPLGECISIRSAGTPCHTIIGIAKDVRGFHRLEETAVRFYVPFSQVPNESTLPSVLLVRAGSAPPSTVAAMVRRELSRALPGASITARTAEDVLAAELRPWRLGALLFGSMALLALLVASIGVYSAVAFSIRQRTRELGIRIALGARAPMLMRMVLAEGVGVVTVGIVVGGLGALAAGRLVAALLYGVTPADLQSLIAAAAMLLVVGVLATLGPALRSTKANPVLVLRSD